jgi:hypothetical protein
MAQPKFFDRLYELDKETIPEQRLKAVAKIVNHEAFNEEHMMAISRAAANLCTWAKAIVFYAQTLKKVIPARERKEL